MDLCRSVAGDEAKLYRCVTGAYNAIEILSHDPKYRLSALEKDPFAFCKTQPENFLEGCYTNMLPAVLMNKDYDLMTAARMVEAIAEPGDTYTVRTGVMLSLFHEFIRVHLADPDYDILEGVRLCRSLKPRSVLPCIDGLAGGHMKYGEPGNEYVRGLAFCGMPELTAAESDRCFGYILPRLRNWYSVEKTKSICESVDEHYRTAYCWGI